MASMASLISGSTARSIAENENSSAPGSLSLLPAKLADRAEGFCEALPFMLENKRGELRPEEGREWWRGPE
jgi:hypothetical protein